MAWKYTHKTTYLILLERQIKEGTSLSFYLTFSTHHFCYVGYVSQSCRAFKTLTLICVTVYSCVSWPIISSRKNMGEETLGES